MGAPYQPEELDAFDLYLKHVRSCWQALQDLSLGHFRVHWRSVTKGATRLSIACTACHFPTYQIGLFASRLEQERGDLPTQGFEVPLGTMLLVCDHADQIIEKLQDPEFRSTFEIAKNLAFLADAV